MKIAKGKNEVDYPLSASGKAQIRKSPVYVIGSANVNGNAWAASQLASIEVAEPYVAFQMQRTATEQGQPAEIVCQVNHNRPFEGAAKATLVGLPTKVTTTELEFTKETKELVFPITTEKDSPAGNPQERHLPGDCHREGRAGDTQPSGHHGTPYRQTAAAQDRRRTQTKANGGENSRLKTRNAETGASDPIADTPPRGREEA